VNFSAYVTMLGGLGFTQVRRGFLLKHPSQPPSVYFNKKGNAKSDAGLVYFTTYRRDLAKFPPELWQEIAPQQKKDEPPKFRTLVPVAGKERAAFQSLLAPGIKGSDDVVEIQDKDGAPQRDASGPPSGGGVFAFAEREQKEHEELQRLELRTDIGPTEKDVLIRARRGQGRYRDNLEKVESACRVTGALDRRHLRATHIKPWFQSDDREKLDGFNGLLLSPHVNHLFDRGYISFSDAGELLISKHMNDMVLTSWGIKPGRTVGTFKPEQKKYLAYHRQQVFEQEAGGRRGKK
jgi:hypothetical protein